MDGDATFAIFGDTDDAQFVAYVKAPNIKMAITGLKVATGLACVNWMVFAVTFYITCMF
jgi:hypothetical protein